MQQLNKEQSEQSQKSGQSQNQGLNGKNKADKPSPDKGLNYYPISDLQFDVVTIVFEKSKALQAYDKYLRDAQANEELRKIFEQVKADDEKHIEALKNFLGNC
jgi:hypothetical protein